MVIEKARELGIALCESTEYVKLIESRRAIEENTALSLLLAEYNQKQQELMGKLEDPEADTTEVEALSHDMENIQGMLVENDTFNAMLSAQSEFASLMKRVNKVIAACIGFESEDPDGDDGDCNGSCASCHGCKH